MTVVIGSTPTNFPNSSLVFLSFMETSHILLIICISAGSNFNPTSDMLDELGWSPLSQSRQEARLILLKLLTAWHNCSSKTSLLRSISKRTRRKHNTKFRQVGHTTSQYCQSFFLKTISAWNGLAFDEDPLLAVFRYNFL